MRLSVLMSICIQPTLYHFLVCKQTSGWESVWMCTSSLTFLTCLRLKDTTPHCRTTLHPTALIEFPPTPPPPPHEKQAGKRLGVGGGGGDQRYFTVPAIIFWLEKTGLRERRKLVVSLQPSPPPPPNWKTNTYKHSVVAMFISFFSGCAQKKRTGAQPLPKCLVFVSK